MKQPMPAEAVSEFCHPEDVDCSHVFPLERFIRKHPSFPFWFILAASVLGAWLDSLA